MPEPLLRVTDLTVHHSRNPALRGVSFTMKRGEIVTVIGPNGAGKSTLMRVIIGALKPDAGEVVAAAGLRIGYVPQMLHVDQQFPLTVRRFLSLPDRVSDQAATEVLAQVGASGLERAQVSELSGGQRQRVLLARALLCRPDLLVLDEPTQGLDQPGTAAFYRLIERVSAELNAAVLLVSHELHVVMRASNRVLCLNGHICCDGTPEAVSAMPAYQELFGTGDHGTLALYRHRHDHSHDAHD